MHPFRVLGLCWPPGLWLVPRLRLADVMEWVGRGSGYPVRGGVTESTRLWTMILAWQT